MSQRVLIVDDLHYIRHMLRHIIEVGGYTVVAEAEDGAEAVEQYREHQPDITIMDLDMPVKSGAEASKEILAIDINARILICTGGVVKSETAMLLESIGVSDIIFKPFRPPQLITAMQKVLQKQDNDPE